MFGINFDIKIVACTVPPLWYHCCRWFDSQRPLLRFRDISRSSNLCLDTFAL